MSFSCQDTGHTAVAFSLVDIERFFGCHPEFSGRKLKLLFRIRKNTQGKHIRVEDLGSILDTDIWVVFKGEVVPVPFELEGLPYDDPEPEIVQ